MNDKTKPTIKIIGLLLTSILLFSFNISSVFSASPLAPKPTKTPTNTPTRTPTRTPSPTPTNTSAPTGTPFTCTSWNIANDFRISPNQENPNRDFCNNVGVWEFMGSGSIPRNPANYYRLPIFTANFGGYNNLNTYHTSSSFPHIGYNAGSTVVEGAITIPASTFDVHPSPFEMAIMTWHSAVNGYINISGGVSDNSPECGDGILWYIDKNTTNVASGGFANGGSQLFSGGAGGAELNTVAVSVGDVIYLAVDPNGGHGCDDTRVDLMISVTSPPTPTLTPTITDTPTVTPTFTPTFTPTNTSTNTPTVTSTPNRGGSGACWASGASWPNYYADYTIDLATIPTSWVNPINSASNTWTNVLPSHFIFNSLAGTNNVVSKGALADPDQLALTSVFATSTTPITKVVTVFSDTKPFDTSNPPASGNYSVENVMTHEFGHWLYLVDNYDQLNCGEVTMYGYISTGETKKISLESADVNAINWQYP